jgi:hypothetical protein
VVTGDTDDLREPAARFQRDDGMADEKEILVNAAREWTLVVECGVPEDEVEELVKFRVPWRNAPSI